MNFEAKTARNFPRKILRCQAKVILTDSVALLAHTRDISLDGVCVHVQQPLVIGQTCTVAFETRLNGKTHQVMASAKVVYSILSGTDGFRTGLQFVQINQANLQTLTELVR